MISSFFKKSLFSFLVLSMSFSFSEEIKKKHHENKMTIYKDLALIDRIENIQSAKNVFSVHHLPLSLHPSSLFLVLNEGKILESTLEDDDKEKKLKLVTKGDINSVLHLTYTADKISWTPHYTATFSSECDKLDFNACIEIHNETNTSFNDIFIMLIDAKSGLMLDEQQERTIDCFQQAYSIEHSINIDKHEKKRINWIDQTNIPTIKEYRLNVGGPFLEDQTNKNATPNVELWVSCLNKAKALPKGNMLIYQKTEDGYKQSLTKMTLPYTKVDQVMAFKMPDHLLEDNKHPFQITFEQTEFQRFTGKLVETANRITVQNTSDQSVVIKVIANFPTKEGVVLRESIPHQSSSDEEFYWVIEIGPKEKTELRYRLRFAQ